MFIVLTRQLPKGKKQRCAVNPDAIQWYQEFDEIMLTAEGYDPVQKIRTQILFDNGPEMFVEEDFDFISAAVDSLPEKK